MPDETPQEQSKRTFWTLKDAATQLGLSYKQARALHSRGYFGDLVRSGQEGRGNYLVPEATLERLRNGERIAS